KKFTASALEECRDDYITEASTPSSAIAAGRVTVEQLRERSAIIPKRDGRVVACTGTRRSR
ncbi:hypothetical protein K0M31_016779, partial [Melipona bicolor]